MKYWKVFEIGLQNTFVYRWNFLLRAVFGIVPLIGTVFIWRAIFEARGAAIGGYEYATMIFYFLLTILVDNLVTPTEDEWQIAADIRDGRISAFLIKPLNYLGYRLTLYASYRLLYTVVTLVPIAFVLWWFRAYLLLPDFPLTWVVFAVSVAMAGLLQFFLAYALAMLAFWILEISTVVFILYSFEYFLSGQIFPLDIMPAWLHGFVQWSPFTYELFFPVQIYMERVEGAALWRGLALQAGWVCAMWLIATLMWRRGVSRYQAVGG
ncbi:MAG TPA: ABC-2 family transporter protein [Chthoniobacteraceae bacterium]|nr:ABC-2 family transporter protein [Chthoniobacteraceae bacterium]